MLFPTLKRLEPIFLPWSKNLFPMVMPPTNCPKVGKILFASAAIAGATASASGIAAAAISGANAAILIVISLLN